MAVVDGNKYTDKQTHAGRTQAWKEMRSKRSSRSRTVYNNPSVPKGRYSGTSVEGQSPTAVTGFKGILFILAGILLMSMLYGVVSGTGYQINTLTLLDRLADMNVFDFTEVCGSINSYFAESSASLAALPDWMSWLGDVWTFIGKIVNFGVMFMLSIYNALVWIWELLGILFGI